MLIIPTELEDQGNHNTPEAPTMHPNTPEEQGMHPNTPDKSGIHGNITKEPGIHANTPEEQDIHSNTPEEMDTACEYSTPDELYELMSKVHNCDSNDDESLTPSELMLLYKNMETGTQLMANAAECRSQRANQYVENIKYSGEETSENSENFSDDSSDEYNWLSGNKERQESYEKESVKSNTLCQKVREYHLNDAGENISSDYKRHVQPVISHTYIQDQIRDIGMKLTSNSGPFNSVVMPITLVDIFCKRLEDNYNFDIDNIIRYVNHTIEQLKRISNGEYLTRVAKEKWMEVEGTPILHTTSAKERSDAKVLTTSTSMPLNFEEKTTGLHPTWDDIIHSELDIRSLSKIFEKKIIIEIPKVIKGSYRLFSNSSGNNVTVDYRDKINSETEPRFNVTFQIQPSTSGHFVSNIEALMVVDGNNISLTDMHAVAKNPILPLLSKEDSSIDLCFETTTRLDIIKSDSVAESWNKDVKVVEIHDQDILDTSRSQIEKITSDVSRHSSNTTISLIDVLGKMSKKPVNPQQFSAFNPTLPDDLKVTIQRLNIQTCLMEESNDENSINNQEMKLKPQANNKISPHENQVHTKEDNRRKRLLEIRDNRGKRKLKNIFDKTPSNHSKCAKGQLAPAASNSVTKLSISNKSFYNSIFGQHGKLVNSKTQKLKAQRKMQKKDKSSEPKIIEIFEKPPSDTLNALTTKTAKDSEVPSNANCLDDVLSEMGYIRCKDTILNAKGQVDESMTKALKQVESSVMFMESLTPNNNLASSLLEHKRSTEHIVANNHYDEDSDSKDCFNVLHCTESKHYLETTYSSVQQLNIATEGDSSAIISTDDSKAHNNTLDETDGASDSKYPSRTKLDCRESIDKIYELMRKIGKTNNVQNPKLMKTKFTTSNLENQLIKVSHSNALSMQESDSGTSVKHRSSTSFLSSFSADKVSKTIHKYNQENIINVPKIIISSKSPTKIKNQAFEFTDKSKTVKEKKKLTNQVFSKATTHNPLPTITQLLHEVDNLQKTKYKTLQDGKARLSVGAFQNNSNRRVSRLDQHNHPVPPTTHLLNDVDNLQKGKNKAAQDGKNYKFGSPVTNLQSNVQRRSRLDQHMKEKEETQNVNRNQPNYIQIRDKKGKPLPQFYICPPVNTDRHRALKKKISDIIDEEKEARGEAVRGPSKYTTRLDALAQPRKAYVQAHSEQFRSKYGRNIISDRLHRLVHTPASAVIRAEPKVVSHWRGKRVPNDIRSTNSAKIAEKPVKQIYHRRASSSPDSKTMSSLVVDEPSAKKCITFGIDNIAKEPKEKKMNEVESYLHNHYGHVNWTRNSRTNLQAVRKTYIPLIPRNSKTGVFQNVSNMDLGLQDFFNSIINSENGGKLNEITEKVPEEAAFDIQDKNITDTECVVDGIINIINDGKVTSNIADYNVLIRCPEQDKIYEEYNEITKTRNKYVLPDLEEVSTNIILENLESALSGHLIIPSQKIFKSPKFPKLPSKIPKNTLILQAGDASTMPSMKPTSSENMLKNYKVKCSGNTITEINDLKKWTHDIPIWNMGSIPMQISTVGYSFPITGNSECVKHERKLYRIANVLNFAVQMPIEYHVCTHLEPSYVLEFPAYQEMMRVTSATSEKATESKEKKNVGTDTDVDEDNSSIGVQFPICNLDCTSSLDVLVNLLNEIHTISTRQTHIASTVGLRTIEHEKPLQFATSYNMKTTMEKVVTYDLITISSQEDLKKLEPYGSLYSLYVSDEGQLVDEEELQNTSYHASISADKAQVQYQDKAVLVEREMVSECTDTSSQSLISPTSCKETSVTSLLLNYIDHPSDTTFTVCDSNKYKTKSSIDLENKYANLNAYNNISSNNVREHQSTYQIVSVYKRHDSVVKFIVKKDKDKQPKENKNEGGDNKDNNTRECYALDIEVDPDSLKMKRDVLLSLYAVLILAVFAAMSYPEILLLQN